jgi:hypothetical protein
MRGYRGWEAVIFGSTVTDNLGVIDAEPAVVETDTLPPLVDCDLPTGRVKCSSYGRADYVSGSYRKTGWAIWDSAIANFPTGVGLVCPMLTTFFSVAFSFSPKIPKVLGLNLQLDFEMSWYRDGIDNV